MMCMIREDCLLLFHQQYSY